MDIDDKYISVIAVDNSDFSEKELKDIIKNCDNYIVVGTKDGHAVGTCFFNGKDLKAWNMMLSCLKDLIRKIHEELMSR